MPPKKGKPTKTDRTPKATKKPAPPKAAVPAKAAGPARPAAPARAAAPAKPAAEDLRPAPPPALTNIPWGYGDNRITAMARDPHWVFAYWEITDEAIAKARAQAGDPNAYCCLRVYDTTGRDFNGLNPNLFWDIGVDRGTNNHYVKTGRPGATFHFDVGVRAGSGLFAPIARSGAVEMPRDSVSSDGGVEWSTVLRSGQGPSYRHRYVPKPGGPPPPPAAPSDGGSFADLEGVFQHFAAEGWTRSEWFETRVDGRVVRWIRWSGPFTADRFPIVPAGTYSRVEVLFQGERKTVKYEQGERYVYGPWHVVLEAVGPQGERRTVHQWMVRHRWTTEEGSTRVETPAILTRILGGQRVTIEKSGSEERLAREQWGSEWLTVGASEWRWIGASETLLAGSSETLMRGASEILWLGASEIARLGASEMRWGGASELSMLGASEGSMLGASDARHIGASENAPREELP